MPKTDVKVKLIGGSGNAYAIMGKVIKALKRAGHGDMVEDYKRQAMSADYDNLLRVTMEFVDVE